jgi:hypothetical protein
MADGHGESTMRRLAFLATSVVVLAFAPAVLANKTPLRDAPAQATWTSQSGGPVGAPSSLARRTRKLESMGWWLAYDTTMPTSAIKWKALTQLVVFTAMTSTASPFLNMDVHNMVSAGRRMVPLAHRHGDRAILAIGGSDDQHWSTACSPRNRRVFTSAVINELHHYGYDGVELDIEQGNWIGTADFNACVKAFHRALKATRTNAGRVPILTLDEDPSWESSYIPGIARYLDQINLMGYNDTCANNCAQVAKSISTLTSRGIRASKLIDGIGLDPGMPDATDPSDCGAKARYLSGKTNVMGVAEWYMQDDYQNNHGSQPCFHALAPYIR